MRKTVSASKLLCRFDEYRDWPRSTIQASNRFKLTSELRATIDLVFERTRCTEVIRDLCFVYVSHVYYEVMPANSLLGFTFNCRSRARSVQRGWQCVIEATSKAASQRLRLVDLVDDLPEMSCQFARFYVRDVRLASSNDIIDLNMESIHRELYS